MDDITVPQLLLAVYEGDLQQVQALLDSGENPLITSPSGWTLLHVAAMTGNRAMVQLLLKNEEAAELVSATTLWGCTPLHSAAALCHEGVVDCLMRAGASEPTSGLVQWSQAAKDTLMLTPSLWRSDIISILHGIGADINAKDREGYSVLQRVAIAGDAEVVKQLLALGAGVRTVTQHHSTPILSAARRGHLAVMQLLVEARAATDARDLAGDSALHLAAMEGHTATVKYLLDVGVDVEAKNGSGQTAVHMAAREGCEGVMELLLGAGADVDARDCVGETPCMLAAAKGHCNVLKQLLAQGADAHKVTTCGPTRVTFERSALFYALDADHPHVAEALLPHLRSCTSTRAERWALEVAAGKGWAHVVRALIAQGINSEEAIKRAAQAAEHEGFMSLWGFLMLEHARRYPESDCHMGVIGPRHLKGLSDAAQEEGRREREGLHRNTQYLVLQAAGMLKRAEGERKALDGAGCRNRNRRRSV